MMGWQATPEFQQEQEIHNFFRKRKDPQGANNVSTPVWRLMPTM
jgi:hypothetical protein